MNEFIVSARKYRPATFDTVVGQQSITTTLKNSIKNNHLGQAYLFCGPRGVGKTTCARIFAKTINCQDLTEQVEACDNCVSCKAFNESTSYNIHELDAASNNSVEDIRNLIDQVRIPPQVGIYSIYIIDEVHMLSTAAFNAFLKTLEEPPKHAIFILATTEKHKILPTILSRCQIFDFNRIKVEDAVDHLASVAEKENISAEAEALNVIALKADGAMRDALSIFDQVVSFCGSTVTYKGVIDNLNVLDYDYFFKLTDSFLAEDYVNSLLIYDEILDKGFDGHNFIAGICEHFRDLLVCKDPETIPLLEVGAAIKEKYKVQAQNSPASFLFSALDIGSKFDLNYKASKNKRLHIELALLQFCNILKKKNELASNDNETEETKPSPTKKSIAEQTTKKSDTFKGSSISFKDIMSGDGLSKQATTSDVKQEGDEIAASPISNEGVVANEFSQDQLIKAWSEFVESIRVDEPRIHALLSSVEPVLRDNFQIGLTIPSQAQQAIFTPVFKGNIRDFLRGKLSNNKIEFVVDIEKPLEQSAKPASSKEKYKYLADKNPMLDKLKDNLDLDIK